MSVEKKQPYVPHAWETVPCPFCNSTEYSIYERFGSELQYTYVLCNNCKLVYQSPRPKYDQQFIDAAYALYSWYVNNLDLNDVTQIKESGVDMFSKEIDYISQFDPKRSAVLDIGCGMGTFLYAAKKVYQEAVGLDVSEKMAEFVEKNIDARVFVQQFEVFQYPRKFSLIHMSHVLEHIPNPNEWMQKAKSMLEPDGILVINVPHKFGLGYRMQHLFYKMKLKKQFSDTWSDPTRTPDHLFEPTIPAMKYLLQKNGYQILNYYTYSRRDPASNGSVKSRLLNRWLKIGSNLTFIIKPINR
jgi:2-polyprenyl-3-methyl-5-hydroxy-6-metoxy-1,4-benzoquinol methylase